MSRWIVLLALVFAACDRGTVVFRVTVPDEEGVERPVAGVTVAFLPYDRDSVLQSLEQRASAPRPHTQILDSLFRTFREPYAAYAGALRTAERLQSSMKRLKAQLEGLSRAAPEYAPLFTRFEREADSLTAVGKVRDAAAVDLERARKTLSPRIDTLRADVRRWEDSTYRDYERTVRGLANSRMYEPVGDSTDVQGYGRVKLRRGEWWVYARSLDARDPNAEWYWNIRAKDDTIRLSPATGRSRPRY